MTGKVIQITGPVVDVEFSEGKVPEIFEALEIEHNGRLVLEVAQQLGFGIVRAISLGPTDGLVRGKEVIATGKSIAVPVGKETLA